MPRPAGTILGSMKLQESFGGNNLGVKKSRQVSIWSRVFSPLLIDWRVQTDVIQSIF